MDKRMGEKCNCLIQNYIYFYCGNRSVDILHNSVRWQFLVLFAYLVASKANLICELDCVTCLSVIRTAEPKVQRSCAESELSAVRFEIMCSLCTRRSRCCLYHWPSHIPKPAPGSQPSLAATLRALFKLWQEQLCVFLPTIRESISAVVFILEPETELPSHNNDTAVTADYRQFQERSIILNFYEVWWYVQDPCAGSVPVCYAFVMCKAKIDSKSKLKHHEMIYVQNSIANKAP